MSAKEWFLNSLKILTNSELDQNLLKIAADALVGIDSRDQIPAKVIEEISKHVEIVFRSSIERFAKQQLDPNTSGWHLVDAALAKGFVEEDGENFMLRWYFKDIRNPSHHQFDTISRTTFLTYFLLSNYILRQFTLWSKRPLLIEMDVNTNKNVYKMGEPITVKAQIRRLDDTIIQRGDIKVQVRFANKFSQVQTMNYMITDNNWQGMISTSGGGAGTF